jgi:hypothetical protein
MKSVESDLQKQLAEARLEEQNALAEFRRWETAYYERAWAKAIEKVKRLEAQIPKQKARSA